MTPAPLSLLTVHAHPDDEASKGAGTVARYHAEGVHTVLVCCTGGEAGEVLNSAVDTEEVRANLHTVRMRELHASVEAIGYDRLELLGYHDSGMPDTETNARHDNFANAPLEEAVERLVKIIRAERPQVIITYAEDREFYPHPDHIRVFEITAPAFEAAGDPGAFVEAGEPWQPSKLYEVGWSRGRITALHQAHLDRGLESPFARWLERDDGPMRGDRHTTLIDVGDFMAHRRAALLAHETQVAPDGFWMKLPDEVLRDVWPWEEYVLVRSLVDTGLAAGEVEHDLFVGLRDPADATR
ncbi:MAG: mycothiol conjugate amidase Mca [Acidimicrobiia bacterium]